MKTRKILETERGGGVKLNEKSEENNEYGCTERERERGTSGGG